LKRARKFSRAIAAVSSTIWRSSKRERTRSNSSSSMTAGVRVIASAYSSTSFSSSEKASLSRKEDSSRSCCSVAPVLRAIIEPISRQNSQPTMAAALSAASSLRLCATLCERSAAISRPP
jgi:hypothetical protein